MIATFVQSIWRWVAHYARFIRHCLRLHTRNIAVSIAPISKHLHRQLLTCVSKSYSTWLLNHVFKLDTKLICPFFNVLWNIFFQFLAIVTESCGGGSFIVIPIDKVSLLSPSTIKPTPFDHFAVIEPSSPLRQYYLGQVKSRLLSLVDNSIHCFYLI